MKKLFILLIAFLVFASFGCSNDPTPYGASIKDGVGYYTLKGTVSSTYFPGALKYFSNSKINKVIMEIHSPGGSIYEMWRIISWMEEHDDIKFEIRVYGVAASASLIIFLAGDERLVSRHSTFMWHNLANYSAGAEFLNKVTNDYIASRTDLTIEQILEKITNKDKNWYFGAGEAIKLGIAHGYIN